jgi:hypothetical protein
VVEIVGKVAKKLLRDVRAFSCNRKRAEGREGLANVEINNPMAAVLR